MSEDPLDKLIRHTARTYNAPPETPREAIWAGVQRNRRLTLVPKRPRVWLWAPIAAAALLAIGIGVGRLSVIAPPQTVADAVQDPPSVVSDPDTRAASPRPDLYRLASAEFLGRTETLLTEFRTTDSAPDPELASWARRLVTQSRLLLDSPAGDDPELGALFLDLELILVQIATVAEGEDVDERAFVTQGLVELLPRLRARIPAGSAWM